MSWNVWHQKRSNLGSSDEAPVAELDALKLSHSGPAADRTRGEAHVRGRQQLSRLREGDPIGRWLRHRSVGFLRDRLGSRRGSRRGGPSIAGGRPGRGGLGGGRCGGGNRLLGLRSIRPRGSRLLLAGPARAFEVNGGHGECLLQRATALGAGRRSLGVDRAHDLDLVAAVGANVVVVRHLVPELR